ncbi:hypothetical protein [Amnibacterium kyonggiense]
MIIRNWKRAGVGACTAAALVVGAGLAFGPAATAAPATDPLGSTSSLVNGTVSSTTATANGTVAGATGLVNGVVSGTTTGGTTTGGTGSPVVTTSGGGADVNLGGTTVGVTTGDGLGAVVTTGGSPIVGVQLGGSAAGATGTATVENGGVGGGGGNGSGTPATSGDPAPSTGSTGSSGSSGSTPSTPVTLTALSVASEWSTVYPAKDGYRDTTVFQLSGTATDGQQHAAGGTLSLQYGSSTVATWPITATNQAIAWNGLQGGRIVPGSYTVTATIGDADGHRASATDRVVVSAKKLATASQLLTSKSVSGTHRMAPKPLDGLSKGKVTLRITSVASKVKGKQYLVFKHAGRSFKIRILNGRHTSKTVTIPRSFTSYTITHTWKKGAVKISSLKYRYTYKALK